MSSRWLRVQLGLAAVGIGVWIACTVIDSEFAAGAGVGLLIGALAVRFLRKAGGSAAE